jgi:DNA-binding LytR/AlgR family response regulator
MAAAPALRVLAVDDEPPALADLAFLLGADQRIARVDCASTATEALRGLDSGDAAGQPLDAVFLDIRMPGMDGLDMARVLSMFSRPPLIVFATGWQDAAAEAAGLRPFGYLRKPVSEEALAATIGRLAAVVAEIRSGRPPTAAFSPLIS